MCEGDTEDLGAIYRNRFDARDLANKRTLWRVLVRDYFQRYVSPTSTVVDLGAGNCEFVNEITAARRVAVDLNPDIASFAAEGVEVLITRSDRMGALEDGT